MPHHFMPRLSYFLTSALQCPDLWAGPGIPTRCEATGSPVPAMPSLPESLLPHNPPTVYSPAYLPVSRSGRPAALLLRRPSGNTTVSGK